MTITIPTTELDESIKIAAEAAVKRLLTEENVHRALSNACKEWVQENKETLVPLAISALKKSITARVISDNVYREFMKKIKEDDFE